MTPCLTCGSLLDAGAERCGSCGEQPHAPDFPFLPCGTTLYERAYAIGAAVGVGRCGLTYAANVRSGLHPVVIKELFLKGCGRAGVTVVPRAGWTESLLDEARQRFLHEAQALAALDHPGLARILGVFEESNTAYVVMECLRGRNLARLLQQRGGRLKEADALDCILKAGEALEAVHRLGLLHGDLKPRDLFLTESSRGREMERVALLDFCTAGKILGGRAPGPLLATPGFTPPEFYSGSAQPGPYTDVYSLAAILYQCLSGTRPPDAGARGKGVLLVNPRQANPWINARVAQAVMHGLEMDSWRRPQSVAEFLDELRFGRTSVTSPPSTLQDRPPAPPGRPPAPPGRTPASPPRSPGAQARSQASSRKSPSLSRPPLSSHGGRVPSSSSPARPVPPSSEAAGTRPAGPGFAPLVCSVRGPSSRRPLAGSVAARTEASLASPSPRLLAPRPALGQIRAPAGWACPVPLVSVVKIPVRPHVATAGGGAVGQHGSDSPAQHAPSLVAPVPVQASRRHRALAGLAMALLAALLGTLAWRGVLPTGNGHPPSPGPTMATTSWAAHRQAVTALAFSPDGRHLLSGGQDRTARLWDVATRREMQTCHVAGAVTALAFAPDGTRFATASEDESIRIWTLLGQQLVRIRAGTTPGCIAFSSDGTRIAGPGASHLLCTWSTASGLPLDSVKVALVPAVLRFAEGTRRVVTLDRTSEESGEAPAVRVNDPGNGISRVAFRCARPQARGAFHLPPASLSESGLVALTRGSDQDGDDWLVAWDVLPAKPIGRSQVRDLEGVLAVSPRGNTALLLLGGRTVAWNVPEGKELFRLAEPAPTLTCAAFSPDGKRYAVGGKDGRIHVGRF